MINRERCVNVGPMCAEHRAWLEARVGLQLALLGRRGERHEGLLVGCQDAEGGATVVVLLCATEVGDC